MLVYQRVFLLGTMENSWMLLEFKDFFLPGHRTVFFLTKKGGMALEAPKSPIGKPQMPKSKSDDG